MKSLTAEEFMVRVRAGGVVTPTDKNYKAYIHGPHPDGDDKFYFESLNDVQKQELVDLYNTFTGEEGIDEFGSLAPFKIRKLRLAYPYHFYVLPFFMKHSST